MKVNASPYPVNFVLQLAKYLSLDTRFPGSKHHLNVRKFIKNYLRVLGEINTQRFELSFKKPLWVNIKSNFQTLKGLPYINSAEGIFYGKLTDCGFGTPYELSKCNPKEKVVLIKEGKLPYRKKEVALYKWKTKGVLIYRDEVDDFYVGISAGLLPTVSVKRGSLIGNLDWIKGEVKLQKVNVKGENIWIDFGNPEATYTLTLVAHYDSKPCTKGAIDNALSVSLLLWLAAEMARDKRKRPYKVRFLFTDGEEYGLLGAKTFVSTLSKMEVKRQFVISVDTVGWHNPAILVRDAEGTNNLYLIERLEKFLTFLGIKDYFTFTTGGSGRSDHIPFREEGSKTLFFASNPFPYRHTSLDTFDVIVPKMVLLWMVLLKNLVKNFHKMGKGI